MTPQQAKILRVPCPYCPTGGVNIPVLGESIDEQIKQLKDPRQCDRCHKFFKFSIKIAVVGAKID